MTTISTLVLGAGGRGTRMQHLTAGVPKHLLPIAGKPFIQYSIETAAAVGLTRFVVVVGYQAEPMVQFLASLPYDITTINQHDRFGDRYGTAVVFAAAEAVVGDQPCLFQSGDMWFTPDVLQAILPDTGQTAVTGFAVPNIRDCGELIVDAAGYLTDIVEKPDHPRTNIANMSLYRLYPRMFQTAKQVAVSPRGEYEITQAIADVLAAEPVQVSQPSGHWLHLSSPDDMVSAERFAANYFSV